MEIWAGKVTHALVKHCALVSTKRTWIRVPPHPLTTVQQVRWTTSATLVLLLTSSPFNIAPTPALSMVFPRVTQCLRDEQLTFQ